MHENSDFQWLVFVKYLDHVLYNRTSALTMQPQVRQAVGWLVYECSLYITIAWDSDAGTPTLHEGDQKASGMVLLKSDIIELEKIEVNELPLQKTSECHLNSQSTKVNIEYALQPKEAKNSHRKREKTK
jgi:hypothetical protein